MSQDEFLIVNQTAAGFRVYPASEPMLQHTVKEENNQFSCTCEVFAEDEVCEHIRAVLARLSEEKRVEVEERKAIQEESRTPPKKKGRSAPAPVPATMSLKRSISPDGRIDSLSVEFSCSVDQASGSEITTRAINMLKLQSAIASSFLSDAKGKASTATNGNGQHKPSTNSPNGAIAATMLSIGSVNGRYGPRLFLAFLANGQTVKLFGTAQELAQAISDGGYRYGPEDIGVGIDLNLPCKVITKPARDPRYTDIARVLPQNGAAKTHARTS